MKIKNAAIFLLAGLAIGTLTGLLIAPDEGARTRKKWLKQAKKYKKDIKNKASDLKDKASDFKDKVSDIKDNIESVAHDVKKRFS